MEEYRLITMNDLEDAELLQWIDTIKEKNLILYNNVMRCMQKADFKGMRDDVLQCLADYADVFHDDDNKNIEVSLQLADLIEDQRIEPDELEWLFNYWNQSALPVSNVIVLFMMAVDKRMSLSEMKMCFDSENEMEIYEHIEKYVGNEHVDSVETSANSSNGVVRVTEGTQQIDSENTIVSVFSDLLTVMSSGKQMDDHDTVLFQKKFTELMTCLQNNVNDINVFVSEIIHEWEKDQEEVRRLKAIYNIQQSALARLQQKLYEAENEISRLQIAVHEAEKMELHYETINQKVGEIQKLTTAVSLND